MNGLEPMAKLLVAMGLTLVLLGGLAWLLSKTGCLGQLPGDIRIERTTRPSDRSTRGMRRMRSRESRAPATSISRSLVE